ncbi:MAG TPA: hypothetical protein VIT91_06115 [Chthoniobacterales bacterium]
MNRPLKQPPAYKYARIPPAKTTSPKAVIVLVAVLGWGVYMALTAAFKQPEPEKYTTKAPTPAESPYVMVDLRGPFFDKGRYEGFEKGKDAAAKGFTMPTSKVLDFQANEAAQNAKAFERNELDDFVAGYRVGFEQGLKEKPQRR